MKYTSSAQNEIYDLLRAKDILAILDGDTKFGNYDFDDGTFVPVAMPYLSGPDLCGLCTLFGLPKTYSKSTAMSRWQYLDELITHCVKNNTCGRLLNYLFEKDRFSRVFRGRGRDEIENAFAIIYITIIDKINGILSFSNVEITVQNGVMGLAKIGTPIVAEVFDSKLKKGNVVLTAFNEYVLKKQVGQGGNGKVWEVTDKDGDSYAIKFLERDNAEKVLKRFKNETFFCMKYSHKNILPILDYGTAGQEFVFYVMPLYKCTLRDKIKESINPEEVSDIFVGILEGLHFAHQKGAIHRDIKPENILFADNSTVPVIADFGIAHFSEEDLATIVETAKGDRMANFQYAAPEQRKKGGTSIPQTDMYAAGLILNEMFTGEIPQALEYKKIADVSPEYGYMDALFEQLFKQEPTERLYPVENIIIEMQSLADKQKNEAEIKRLRETSISLQMPEEYNPKVTGVKYDSGRLLFELDQPVNADWFQILASGSYSHSCIMGFDTNRLQKHANNVIAMPMRADEQKSTAKSIVENVKSWVNNANGLYRNAIKQQLEREQRTREQKRLEEIRKLEKANEMSEFLSSLL